MESSGNSSGFFGGGSAEVSADLGMSVRVQYDLFAAENEAKPFGAGSLVPEEPPEMGRDFGAIKKLSGNEHQGYASGIAGLTVASRSSSQWMLVADKDKLSRLALQAIAASNAELAKFLKENAPN